MSPSVLIVVALAAGIVVGLIARKMSMSWVIAGGGGFIAAVAAFIALAPSPPANDTKPEVQSAAPAIVNQPAAPATQPPPQPTPQVPQPQVTQVDPAVQQRCIQQAKSQGYRSGQCAFTFIDTCIKTQSRKEMEAALRVDAMTGMGQALTCPNMPSTFSAEFDKF